MKLQTMSAWMHNRVHAGKAVVAVLVTLVMLVATAIGAGIQANAVEAPVYTADPTTFTQWTEGVGDPVNPSSTGRVWTDKSVSTKTVTLTTYDGKEVTISNDNPDEFLVGLSAMSSAQQITGISNGGKPLDITLVLDVSGSMDSTMSSVYTPVYDLKATGTSYYIADPANANKYLLLHKASSSDPAPYYYYDADGAEVFVNPKTSADDADPAHVQFYVITRPTRMEALKQSVDNFIDLMAERNATMSNDAMLNRAGIVTYASSGTLVNTFTSDTAQLKESVNNLRASGGTYAARGLQVAEQLINTSKRADAESVLIFFTDGSPFDYAATIQQAKSLKASGNTIYSVGVFTGADANDLTTTQNRYMQAVSSNYPDATMYDNLGDRVADGDYYLTAQDSDQLKNVFHDIWTAISSKPTSPIESTKESGMERGAVTFTDTLGDYMEVRDFKSVLFAGIEFEQKTSETVDDVTTYTFEGDVEGNPIYGSASVSELQISVKHGEGAEGDIVTVVIPEQLLPLRLYTATIDQDGNVTTDIQRTHPIRVFYTVGLKEGVADQLENPDEELAQYIAQNTADNGDIQFTSNAYEPGAELGSTVASFTPAKTNAFYYFTEDTPLYNSKDVNDPAQSIDPNGTYYYVRTYYSENAAHEQWIEVKGTVAEGKVAQDVQGNWYAKAGEARLGLANYTTMKIANPTETASAAIAPRWDGTIVNVALGNNGLLAFPTAVPAEEDQKQPEQNMNVPGDVDVPQGAAVGEAPAHTGSSIAVIAGTTIVLLVLGGVMLVLVRRRNE